MEMILSGTSDFVMILRKWEEEHTSENYNPLPTVIRLAKIIESQTNVYLLTNPDPLDERHPSRIDPDQALGHILKIFNRQRNFMNKLVKDYFRDNYWSENGCPNKDPRELFTAICRLLLDVMPDPETCTRFLSPETDPIVLRFFSWADKSEEPLRSYATGLLAATMKLQNRAFHFRDQNNVLIPVMMQRLHELQTGHAGEYVASSSSSFSSFFESSDSEDECGEKKLENKLQSNNTTDSESKEGSNIQIHPADIRTRQMLIMQYLGAVGKYPEFVSRASDNNALELIFYRINFKEPADVLLTCEALKYLSRLLKHKQFAIEFLNMNGLQMLLEFSSHSRCGTAVSVCLYSLSCNQEIMDQVCSSPQALLTAIIKYVLELFECTHDSGRFYATMFCSSSFCYYRVLKIFDAENGLQKLYHLIQTLSLLVSYDLSVLFDDEENAARKTIQCVCFAIKCYLEAHLCVKAQNLTKTQPYSTIEELANSQPSEKLKVSSEDVQEHVNLLFNHLPFCSRWKAVEKLVKLGGIELFLQIIEFSYEWNAPDGGASSIIEDILRCVLDILAICCLMPQVKLQLCNTVALLEDSILVGTNIVLKAAEGKIISDPKVQKSALHVVINCVCAPLREIDGTIPVLTISSKKKTIFKTSEEILQKVWESVRNNGMMILLHLMFVTTPIMHADAIRALACRAVVGLARSERIRQSIRKLPLFTRGQLQTVMYNPVLKDKIQEHENFQKNALELLECLELVRKRKRTPTPPCEWSPLSGSGKNN